MLIGDGHTQHLAREELLHADDQVTLERKVVVMPKIDAAKLQEGSGYRSASSRFPHRRRRR